MRNPALAPTLSDFDVSSLTNAGSHASARRLVSPDRLKPLVPEGVPLEVQRMNEARWERGCQQLLARIASRFQESDLADVLIVEVE